MSISLVMEIKWELIFTLCVRLCLISVRKELSLITPCKDVDIDVPVLKSDNWDRYLIILRESSYYDLSCKNSWVYKAEIGGFFVLESKLYKWGSDLSVWLNISKYKAMKCSGDLKMETPNIINYNTVLVIKIGMLPSDTIIIHNRIGNANKNRPINNYEAWMCLEIFSHSDK